MVFASSHGDALRLQSDRKPSTDKIDEKLQCEEKWCVQRTEDEEDDVAEFRCVMRPNKPDRE